MGSNDFTVRIGQEEIGHILDRKENLDHHGHLWEFMSRYQALGWHLAVVTPQGADLGLDLQQPQEVWWKQLADLGLEGVQVNLAIHTGRLSRLLVLEVNKGGGTLSLDLLGDWRAQCVAELGNCREQHYYYLPPDIQPPASHFLAQEVLIYGQDGLVLAPPSLELEGREPWSWITPPWESPPQAPKPAVWQFIREQTTPAASSARGLPCWEELYQTIAPHEPVIKALLLPPSNLDNYYRDILHAVRVAGLADRQTILGLLWHAPHGDSRSNGERWQYLQHLVAGENLQPAGPSPAPGGLVPTGDPSPGTWPACPAPELPAMAAPRPQESMDLALGVGELTRQLLGEADTEPTHYKFEKTVSGQYFQLLAALGEKVITESCRNEAILSTAGTQATELERLVAEIEQFAVPPAARERDPKAGLRPAGGGAPVPPWAAAMGPQQGQKSRKLQEVKAMVQDFLSKNPDLAEDRGKVQMVLFCLKNYVSINPDYAGLSFRDKLEKAGQMARSFLPQPAKPQ